MTSERLRVLDDLEPPDLWNEIEGRRPRTERLALTPRRHRAITLAVAAAVGLASILIATSVIGPNGRNVGSLETSTWVAHDIRPLELMFRSPVGWHVQGFDEPHLAGSLISNVEYTFRHRDLGPDAWTSAWDLSGLPRDAVVISVERFSGGPHPVDQPSDTELPLSLDSAKTIDTYRPAVGWTHLWISFTRSGLNEDVQVWFGPEASGHDREIARRIVASIAPLMHSLDGWNVGIGWGFSASGPLQIGVTGLWTTAPENDAHPWIRHKIVLKNTGAETLHFDDTDVSTFLGLPEPELLAADEGCGWAQASPTAPVEAGACRLSLDTFEIPPGGTVKKEVTLFKDLPGMAPLQEGQYAFEKVYRFRVGDSETKTTVHLRLIYDVEKA
jgi:hypothetical protein